MTREVDLVEEVARIYGVDKFPSRLPAAKLPAARLESAEADDRLREILIGLGYQEIITIPIVDEPSDAMFRAGKRRARAHRESARRRRLRDALDRRHDDGANAGMESESRAAQCPPI